MPSNAVGYPEDNAWSLPLAKECSCPAVPHRSPTQRCPEPGKKAKEDALFLCSLQWDTAAPCTPLQTRHRGATLQGRTRAAVEAARHSPAERGARRPQARPRTAEGKETQLQREGRPEFPRAAALQCSSSSEGRVKVFAHGIIFKDIWVLLSHALSFFFFFLFK